jgi:hypothetical protein
MPSTQLHVQWPEPLMEAQWGGSQNELAGQHRWSPPQTLSASQSSDFAHGSVTQGSAPLAQAKRWHPFESSTGPPPHQLPWGQYDCIGGHVSAPPAPPPSVDAVPPVAAEPPLPRSSELELPHAVTMTAKTAINAIRSML